MYIQNNKTDPYLTPETKKPSQWISEPNVSDNAIKLFSTNTG
jgi:hypothetical protein